MPFLETYFWWILLILTVIFIFLFKRITKRPDALTSKFEAVKYIDSNSENMRKKIRDALEKAQFINIGYDEKENRFYAQTKFSMSSWSEYIEVKISTKENRTELRFKSICTFPIQLYDWGKNKRNYQIFNKELDKLLS